MKHLLAVATVSAGIWLATPAWANLSLFSGGTSDGPLGALSQPASTGKPESETARFERVTFWGLHDRRTWRRGQHPLILDANGRPKPAYAAIVQ